MNTPHPVSVRFANRLDPRRSLDSLHFPHVFAVDEQKKASAIARTKCDKVHLIGSGDERDSSLGEQSLIDVSSPRERHAQEKVGTSLVEEQGDGDRRVSRGGTIL